MSTTADILFFDKDCPLDAVVSLAEPRDVSGLNGAFLSILKEHISHRAVAVYEIATDYCARPEDEPPHTQTLRLILETQEGNSTTQLEIEDSDVQGCITKKQAITGLSSSSRLERTILPIPGLPSPHGLLVIEGKIDKSCKNFLDPLLRIYSSHAFILNKNEHDSLTGLFNRHVMENKLNQIFQSQAKGKRKNDAQGQTWCIALLDIDYFKMINDQHGHLFGDEVLILFSRLLQASFRDDDMVFRYGGEEFLIALKNVDLNKADMVLNRFRKRVENTTFTKINQLTVSIGFTALDTSHTLQTIVERADRSLYYSKHQGRNQTGCFEKLHEQGLIEDADTASDHINIFPQQKIIS